MVMVLGGDMVCKRVGSPLQVVEVFLGCGV